MEPGPGPDPGPGAGADPAADPDVEPLPRGGFRCRLCQISAANRPSLLSHLAGKRHGRLRSLRAERRAQEQRSLFVSGFARGTEPARLRQHFRAFGEVTAVVMDKEKGAFAIVELREAAARQRALQQPRHQLDGRRLRVRPRQHRSFPGTPPRDPPGTPPRDPPGTPPGLLRELGQAQDVQAQLQLLVRALELSAAERRLRELLVALLQEAFSEFFPGCSLVPYGSSVNGFDVHGCDLDLHLELGDPRSPEPPSGDPQSQGTPNGDPRSPEPPSGDPQSPEPPSGDPQIQETPNGDPRSPEPPSGDPQNQETPNGDPQTQGTLLGAGDPPPNGSLLGHRDPPVEGSPLGSEGSPLGSEGSHFGGSHLGSVLGDRDPPLEGSSLGSEGSPWGSEGSLGGGRRDPSPSCSEGSLSGDESPEAGDSPGGSGGSLLGRGAPPERVLALVGAVLRRCVPGVRRVRAVPGARRPVVKFSHKQSGLAGDVSLDNRLALFNSRFLRLCADADARVRPLGYAVRLWAARQRLAGGGPLLTNYALTLLLVLFLQSRSPPVLPSVRRLRQLAGPQDRAQVGGWDCSFPRELEASENSESAASLLAEFFSYFSTLDLGGLLLSPLEGRALPRPPPGTLEGLRPGPLTLQDPFELSHNVAANVTPRTVSRFVRCCRDAARLCRGPEFLQKSRRGRPWGLMRLLQPGPAASPDDPRGKFLIELPLPPPGGSRGVPQREVCAAVAFVLGELLGCGCEPEGTPGDGGELLRDPSEVLGRSQGEFGTPGDEGERLQDPPEVSGGSRGEFGTPGDEGELLQDPLEMSGGSQGGFGTPGDGGELLRDPPEVSGGSRGEFGTPGDGGELLRDPLEVSGGSQGGFGTLGDEEETLVDPPSPEAAGAGSRCHLGEAAGDSPGGFGDAGTAGPGWKRPLPEGAANGAGVPPAKRPRLPELPSRWSCCVWHRVWRGRRRLRRRLRGGSGTAPDTEGSRGAQGPEGPEGPGGARGAGGAPDPGGVQGPDGPGGAQGPGGSPDPGGAQGPERVGGPGGAQGPGMSPLALERAVTEAIVRGDPATPPEPLLRFQLSARPGGSRRDPQMLLRLQPEPDPPSPLFQEFFHFLRSFLPEMVRRRLGWGAGGAEPPGGGAFVRPEVLQ